MSTSRTKKMFRTAGEGSTGRYRLRKQTKSQTRLVDGKRLFALHALSVEKAQAFEARDFGEGIVGVSLYGAGAKTLKASEESAQATDRRPRRKTT